MPVMFLTCFMQIVFNDGSIKEELMKTVQLHRKARGEDIFKNFYASCLEMNVPTSRRPTKIKSLCQLPHMWLQPWLVKTSVYLDFGMKALLSQTFIQGAFRI
jgi:hypothetical protein